MTKLYQIYSKLADIAEKEFEDIIKSTDFIGGKASAPNKLRIFFIDNSFLDVSTTALIKTQKKVSLMKTTRRQLEMFLGSSEGN
jgi:hypothetical protein